jgi:hypothetical protein
MERIAAAISDIYVMENYLRQKPFLASGQDSNFWSQQCPVFRARIHCFILWYV